MRGPSRSDRAAGNEEEVVLPLPGPRTEIPKTTAFRSTWILSSIESLRLAGYADRYVAALHAHREEVLSCIAGVWLPMNVVHAHYSACDALGLTSREITEIGATQGNQARKGWRATFVGDPARDASPWDPLSQLQRMWQRSAQGGAVAVHRLNKCHARVEYVACELFAIPFFRHALRAALVRMVEPLAGMPLVRELPRTRGDEGLYSVRWGTSAAPTES